MNPSIGAKRPSPFPGPDSMHGVSASYATALIIDEPWITLLLRGEKTWEMRSTQTTKRGPIALIRKGSGLVVGTARLTDCLGPFDDAQVAAHEARHRVPLAKIGKWRHAWVMADCRALAQPVPYRHPNGAVIWVRLDDDAAARVQMIATASP